MYSIPNIQNLKRSGHPLLATLVTAGYAAARYSLGLSKAESAVLLSSRDALPTIPMPIQWRLLLVSFPKQSRRVVL